jgi:mRNA-degrading endonuclease RelE of RelBE toxin-antitoxin system
MWKVNFSKDSERFLESIPVKHAAQIIRRIEALAGDPDLTGAAMVRAAGGFKRLRSGEYRIIFHQEGQNLLIDLIDKRNDAAVYRRLERK